MTVPVVPPSEPVIQQKIVKTSMNLPEQSLETLRELAARTGTSMAEVVRKAIETDKFLRDAARQGSKILIKDKDDSMRQLILL